MLGQGGVGVGDDGVLGQARGSLGPLGLAAEELLDGGAGGQSQGGVGGKGGRTRIWPIWLCASSALSIVESLSLPPPDLLPVFSFVCLISSDAPPRSSSIWSRGM